MIAKQKSKGVSPLVATVLLIAFTMAIAAVLTAWMTTFTAEQQEKSKPHEAEINCIYAGIDPEFDFMIYDQANGVFNGRLISTGSVDVRITKYKAWYKDVPNYITWTISTNESTGIVAKGTFTGFFDVRYTPPGETGLAKLIKIQFLTPCASVWATIEEPVAGWRTTAYDLNTIHVMSATHD